MKEPTNSTNNAITRRHILKSAGAAAALAVNPLNAFSQPTGPQAFRFAHLTDIHIKPEDRAPENFRQCLKVVHQLKPRPDFILSGGDMVADVMGADENKAKKLFDLYTSICNQSDIPIHHCIGNHDIFGWANKKTKVSPDHPLYGRKMFKQRLDLASTTYSFDHKGWHFCVVDDILPRPPQDQTGRYIGGISQANLAWLDRDLTAAADKPKIICMHIPVVSVSLFRNQDAINKPALKVPRKSVCQNPGPIFKLLQKHNVTLVLTGHRHINESFRFQKTTHITDAAVCGAWWKGPHQGNPPGFGLIDLNPNKTFQHQYLTYG
ncbi:MAG: metallophosphoesterase family protein [Planctomycetota bacterium]|jgi:3',5'-cyclic AMP phosphodiesterase CpdA